MFVILNLQLCNIAKYDSDIGPRFLATMLHHPEAIKG